MTSITDTLWKSHSHLVWKSDWTTSYNQRKRTYRANPFGRQRGKGCGNRQHHKYDQRTEHCLKISEILMEQEKTTWMVSSGEIFWLHFSLRMKRVLVLHLREEGRKRNHGLKHTCQRYDVNDTISDAMIREIARCFFYACRVITGALFANLFFPYKFSGRTESKKI